jgi:hypothetical protein
MAESLILGGQLVAKKSEGSSPKVQGLQKVYRMLVICGATLLTGCAREGDHLGAGAVVQPPAIGFYVWAPLFDGG